MLWKKGFIDHKDFSILAPLKLSRGLGAMYARPPPPGHHAPAAVGFRRGSAG